MALKDAAAAQLQMVEFGRGYYYQAPLRIRDLSISSTILQQMVSLEKASLNHFKGFVNEKAPRRLVTGDVTGLPPNLLLNWTKE